MAKTILVTGGAGFLGSHLCDYLIAKGYRVICMDNLITGDKLNIAHLESNQNFKYISHDVTSFIKIDEDIHYILHFASPASPAAYLKAPIQTLKAGSLGTHNALGLARVKKAVFLLASTSEIYGDPDIHPQKESYWGNVNTMSPRGCYDEAKRFAEALTMAYNRFHNVDTKIARIFNTYGPRMKPDDGRAIPAFINQALKNHDITVFGDGSQTRSFCYVSDLIEGIYRLMLSETNMPVNLGNPKDMTILELAQFIIKLTGSKSKIVHHKLPQDDPKIRQPDISRAKELLNWEPKVGLEEGIRKIINFFQLNKKIYIENLR